MEPTFTPEKETPNQPPPGEQQMRTDNETRALNHKFYTNCMIAGLMLVTIVTAAYVLNKKSEREEALERKRIELQQALVLASLRDRKIPGISPPNA